MKFSQETQDKIVEAMEDPNSQIKTISEILGVHREAILNYRKANPEFNDRMNLARRRAADKCLEKIWELSNMDDELKKKDPAWGRVALDGLKWLAARLNPEYSEKFVVEVTEKLDIRMALVSADERIKALTERRKLRLPDITSVVLPYAERVGAERVGAERVGAERVGAERVGAERVGREDVEG